MNERRYVNGTLMRYGYTTGSCAAAAAKAALLYLLTDVKPRAVDITTASGKELHLIVEKSACDGEVAEAAIRKDAGDDPDVTHGALICASVEIVSRDDAHPDPMRMLADSALENGGDGAFESTGAGDDAGLGQVEAASIRGRAERVSFFDEESGREHGFVCLIEGGKGIGRVTKPGLDQPVGAAAINSGPRKMIVTAAAEALKQARLLMRSVSGGEEDRTGHGPEKPSGDASGAGRREAAPDLLSGKSYLRIIISAPEGELLGKRTFNPMMGIVGGISILGTTGIVEPMSDSAVAGTIEAEVRVLAAQGHRKLMINLGNYGENFTTNVLGLSTTPSVKCANFIGVAMDAAVAEGMDHVLLVGHIGKLVKLGISMFNTHSNNGDGRLETLAACAVEAGLDLEIVRNLLACVTTEAAIEVLDSHRCLEPVLDVLKKRIKANIDRHMPDSVRMEFICFSGKIGHWRRLFQSDGAEQMAVLWAKCGSASL